MHNFYSNLSRYDWDADPNAERIAPKDPANGDYPIAAIPEDNPHRLADITLIKHAPEMLKFLCFIVEHFPAEDAYRDAEMSDYIAYKADRLLGRIENFYSVLCDERDTNDGSYASYQGGKLLESIAGSDPVNA